MGYWLVKSEENSKECKSSRYTEQLLPLGLRWGARALTRPKTLSRGHMVQKSLRCVMVGPVGICPPELALSHSSAHHGETSHWRHSAPEPLKQGAGGSCLLLGVAGLCAAVPGGPRSPLVVGGGAVE